MDPMGYRWPILSFPKSLFPHVFRRFQRGAPDLQFHFQPMSTTGTPAVYLDAFDAFTASVCILRTGRERRERWGEFVGIWWDFMGILLGFSEDVVELWGFWWWLDGDFVGFDRIWWWFHGIWWDLNGDFVGFEWWTLALFFLDGSMGDFPGVMWFPGWTHHGNFGLGNRDSDSPFCIP